MDFSKFNKFNLIDFLDTIDKQDDKYAWIHILCLIIPLLIIFSILRKILKAILRFFFRTIFFCFRGDEDEHEIPEKKKLIKKAPYENKKANNNDNKISVKKDLDVSNFSPSLSPGKKNKKKKKKTSNKVSPKISKEYIYSILDDDIIDQIDYYNPETLGYPYYPPMKYWKQNINTKGGQPPKQDEWLKMVKTVFVSTNKDKGIVVRINFPYSER